MSQDINPGWLREQYTGRKRSTLSIAAGPGVIDETAACAAASRTSAPPGVHSRQGIPPHPR